RPRPPRDRRVSGDLPRATAQAVRGDGGGTAAAIEDGFRDHEGADVRPEGRLLPRAGAGDDDERGGGLAASRGLPASTAGRNLAMKHGLLFLLCLAACKQAPPPARPAASPAAAVK